jgi:serine/threonine protein kinase
VRSSLRVRLQCNDDGFLDFLACLLTLDPEKRPTAALALQHPWLRPENAFPVEPYELP